jgi:hypothetical protein
MIKARRQGLADPTGLMEGKVEILAYKKGVLFDHQILHNILLYQGLAEVMRTLVVTSPSTKPRVITRMAIGDQGTIPSDSTVAKVPVKSATGLFHEVYRKDVDSSTPTLYTPTGFTYTGNTLVSSNIITSMSSVSGITIGTLITGTGIPTGTVVTDPLYGPSSIQISNAATSTNTATNLNFTTAVNECLFVATFDATVVPLTAFSNPSQPRVNEVGLVIIDPTAPAGLVRPSVAAPNAPSVDEVVLSLRTFKSVPFEAANDITITIRYTLYTE